MRKLITMTNPAPEVKQLSPISHQCPICDAADIKTNGNYCIILTNLMCVINASFDFEIVDKTDTLRLALLSIAQTTTEPNSELYKLIGKAMYLSLIHI